MSKRPDREQMAFALFLHESGQDEAFLRRIWEGHPAEHPVKLNYYGLADAVLSSLALKTETDQELQDRIEVLEKNLAYEVAQKIKLAEQLQAATATDLTLEQARWKMHAGIESRCSEEVAAEVKPVIDLVFSSLALEPEARETEVVEFNDGPAFRSKGMVHTLTVAPTSGGWLVTCQDFHGESSCNLPSGDAIKLAQMLHPGAREESKLAEILARAEEVRQDDGWGIGGAWGDYGEVVVPLRILSYVIEGELDQKIASTDPGFALTYAEQVRRAETAEEKLAEACEEPSGTGRSS